MMKKFSIVPLVIMFSLAFWGSTAYAEMAKEGSGEYRGGKSGTFEVLAMGKGRLQMNFDSKGVMIDAPENSPITNASFHILGTLHAVDKKSEAIGAIILTRPNGDQVFGTFKSKGVLGVGTSEGLIEFVGGTGECAGITGKMEIMPRPVVKTSKKGTYQGIVVGKITWKIP